MVTGGANERTVQQVVGACIGIVAWGGVLLGTPVLADEIAGLDLSTLSIEELLDLRESIDGELQSQGYVLYTDINRGDSGEAVVKVQTRLAELGYYSGRITGKFDSPTQVAFKMFEKENGLERDGLPSIADQLVLFDDNAVGKNTKQEVAANEPSEQQSESKYEDYTSFDYGEFARYPDDHLFEKVAVSGKVVQVIGAPSSDSDSNYGIRLATANGTDVVYVSIPFNPGYNILEDDRLTVYGFSVGTATYEAIFGQEVTIPAVIAHEVVLKQSS